MFTTAGDNLQNGIEYLDSSTAITNAYKTTNTIQHKIKMPRQLKFRLPTPGYRNRNNSYCHTEVIECPVSYEQELATAPVSPDAFSYSSLLNDIFLDSDGDIGVG